MLVRFADEGADVFDRDATAGAGRANAAKIDAELAGEPANGGTGGGDGVTIAGTFVFAVLIDRRCGDGRARRRGRCRFLGAGGCGFGASFTVAGASSTEAWRPSAQEAQRLAQALAAGAAGAFAAGAAAVPAESISMKAAPTLIVSPSETRIFVILPADGLGTGIVALSVSSSIRS